eukprot:10328-Heterococcus_DN1.PRE.1
MDAEQLAAAAAKIQSVQRGRFVRSQKRKTSADAKTARAQREAAAVLELLNTQLANVVQSHSAAATKIQARIRGHQVKQHISQIADRFSPLDFAGIKKGLHTLGRNPHTLRHCMIGCSLQALELSDLAAIAEFPLLQTVDVSYNAIADLTPLAALPFLQELNASHNSITDVLAYKVLQGKDFRAWSHVLLQLRAVNSQHFLLRSHCDQSPTNSCIAKWSELESWQTEIPRQHSVLTSADLSYNNITSIRALSHHCNLQRLNLSSNGIKVIAGLEGLVCLRHLDLSCNSITTIQGLDGLPLVELNLSDNSITIIQNLPGEVFTTNMDNNSSSAISISSSSKSVPLRRLNLARNAITDLSGLQHCTSVVALELTGNAVAAVRQT